MQESVPACPGQGSSLFPDSDGNPRRSDPRAPRVEAPARRHRLGASAPRGRGVRAADSARRARLPRAEGEAEQQAMASRMRAPSPSPRPPEAPGRRRSKASRPTAAAEAPEETAEEPCRRGRRRRRRAARAGRRGRGRGPRRRSTTRLSRRSRPASSTGSHRGGPPPDEPPIETLDTVEHALPDRRPGRARGAAASEEPAPSRSEESLQRRLDEQRSQERTRIRRPRTRGQ